MPESRWNELLSTTASRGVARPDPVQELAAAGSGSSGNASPSAGSVAAVQLPGSQVSTSDVTEQLSVLSTQLGSLASTQQEQTDAVQKNTQAVTQNTVEKGEAELRLRALLEASLQRCLAEGLPSLRSSAD